MPEDGEELHAMQEYRKEVGLVSMDFPGSLFLVGSVDVGSI